MRIELMDQFLTLAGEHDVIFTASSAVDPIICKDDLAAMDVCGDIVEGKRRLVDIAVPRTHANCSEDANTVVYNVDDLKELAELNKAKRGSRGQRGGGSLLRSNAPLSVERTVWKPFRPSSVCQKKAENIRSAELDEGGGQARGWFDQQAKEGRRRALERHRQQAVASPDGRFARTAPTRRRSP